MSKKKDGLIERYQPLFELANIGEVHGLSIKVHGSDHGKPNFHVIKKDEFLAEFEIPKTAEEELKFLGYKLHKRDIKPKEIKIVREWLKEPFKGSAITNLQQIQFQWDILEPK